MCLYPSLFVSSVILALYIYFVQYMLFLSQTRSSVSEEPTNQNINLRKDGKLGKPTTHNHRKSKKQESTRDSRQTNEPSDRSVPVESTERTSLVPLSENDSDIVAAAPAMKDNREPKKVKRKARHSSDTKPPTLTPNKQLTECRVADAALHKAEPQCQLTSETVMSYEIQGAEDSGVDESSETTQKKPKSRPRKQSRLKKRRRTGSVEVSDEVNVGDMYSQ